MFLANIQLIARNVSIDHTVASGRHQKLRLPRPKLLNRRFSKEGKGNSFKELLSEQI